MKKIFIAMFFFTSLLFVSCESEDSGNVSTVTHYPTITLNGERTEIIFQGDTYTEKGAVSTAGSDVLTTTITGNVDTNTIGVYKISYSAKNTDGYDAIKTRAVVVMSKAPSAIDISGTFFRNGNANNVTRISDRVYKCDNATGYNVAADKITLTFYNLDDKKIYAPFQEKTSASGLDAESNVGNIISKDKWNWVIFASGVFGTSQRNFAR
ncbi:MULTISPECIES: DUF5011 domain-containing protein [Flavobacterium]|uniref:DUF5011 domain-containing protein n=1 Tax=Flavobacterium TaxID=237 RepID=UPI0022AC8944|nr:MULTISPECIES: DUF5011 domain-containing protein [Flavobacterium]